jgi:hypothetical protein
MPCAALCALLFGSYELVWRLNWQAFSVSETTRYVEYAPGNVPRVSEVPSLLMVILHGPQPCAARGEKRKVCE